MVKLTVVRRNKEMIILCAVAVLIFLLTFPKIGGPTTAGLDPSYSFAFNYFFDRQIQIGESIIFSFGPLGFLLFAQPIGFNLEVALMIVSIVRLLFIFSFLYLLYIVDQHKGILTRFIGISIVLLVTHLIDLGYSLIFLTAICVLLQWETKSKKYLYMAVIITVLALLVKSSFGILSLLILFSYSVLNFLQTKKLKEFILIYVGLLVTFLFSWLLLYGNLGGIFHYIWGTLELAKGNSSAMTINPSNNWLLLILFLITFSCIPLYVRDKKIYLLYAMFFLALLAAWKYAFSRIDHVSFFVHLIFLFYMLVLAYLSNKRRLLGAVVILSLSILFLNMNTKHIGFQTFNVVDQVVEKISKPKDQNHTYYFHFEKDISHLYFLRFKDYKRQLIEMSEHNLASREMNRNAIWMIGDKPVDTYPWETTFIDINQLNWKPRPVFQSYITYTPWLDQQNATFFRSDAAPQFIIWEIEHWGGEMGSIDGRYLLNDEPLTIYEIFKHYQLVYKDHQVALLQRTEQTSFSEREIINMTEEGWNKWIKVPAIKQDGFLRAKIQPSRQMLGKIKRLLYKEHDFFIEYKLEHGEVLRYRFVLDNATSGVWINPLITSLGLPGGSMYKVHVKEIRLSHAEADFFHDLLEIEWEFFEVFN